MRKNEEEFFPFYNHHIIFSVTFILLLFYRFSLSGVEKKLYICVVFPFLFVSAKELFCFQQTFLLKIFSGKVVFSPLL